MRTIYPYTPANFKDATAVVLLLEASNILGALARHDTNEPYARGAHARAAEFLERAAFLLDQELNRLIEGRVRTQRLQPDTRLAELAEVLYQHWAVLPPQHAHTAIDTDLRTVLFECMSEGYYVKNFHPTIDARPTGAVPCAWAAAAIEANPSVEPNPPISRFTQTQLLGALDAMRATWRTTSLRAEYGHIADFVRKLWVRFVVLCHNMFGAGVCALDHPGFTVVHDGLAARSDKFVDVGEAFFSDWERERQWHESLAPTGALPPLATSVRTAFDAWLHAAMVSNEAATMIERSVTTHFFNDIVPPGATGLVVRDSAYATVGAYTALSRVDAPLVKILGHTLKRVRDITNGAAGRCYPEARAYIARVLIDQASVVHLDGTRLPHVMLRFTDTEPPALDLSPAIYQCMGDLYVRLAPDVLLHTTDITCAIHAWMQAVAPESRLFDDIFRTGAFNPWPIVHVTHTAFENVDYLDYLEQ